MYKIGGAALIGIGLVVGSYLYGVRAGTKATLLDVLQSRVESIEEKDQIDNEVEGLDLDALRDRAMRFVR